VAPTRTCTQCGSEGWIVDERVGRTLHTVCVSCGWCATHGNYWLVNGRRGGEPAASEPAAAAVRTGA